MSKASKMKEVTLSDISFVKPSELEPGHTISGVFLEAKYGDYDNPTIIVETEEGRIGLNSTRKLTALMAKVPAGANVEIEYKGEDTLTSGKYKGKKFHDFAVRSDQVLEAGAASDDDAGESTRSRASRVKKELAE